MNPLAFIIIMRYFFCTFICFLKEEKTNTVQVLSSLCVYTYKGINAQY